MHTSRIASVLRYIVLGGAFLIPFSVFVFSSDLFFPYVGGKNFAFRAIAGSMTTAWLALAFLDTSYRPKKHALLYALIGFTGIIGIATIFSFDPLRSFWSTFERMEGYVTILFLAGYMLAISSVMEKEKMWLWLFRTMLFVSVLVGMGGLAELGEVNRVAGILGNAAYLGSYAMLHAGLALFLLVRPGIARIERYVYGAIAFFNLWVMYSTATRGAMVGFVSGAIIAALLYAFFARAQEEKKFRIVSGGVIALLLVLGGLFFSVRDASFVKESRVLRRFASISTEDRTTRARLLAWGIALDGWKDRPILGWGPENFDYVFLTHYDARLYNMEPFYDRAHNIFLDWLIAGGVLGLLGYLSLYGAFLFMVWRGDMSVGEKSILSGLILGHAAQNFFVFDTITSYLFFFTILSYGASRNAHSRVGEHVVLPEVYRVAGALVVSIAGIFFVYGAVVPGMETSTAIINAKRVAYAKEITDPTETFSRAVDGGYFGRSEAREHVVQTAQQIFNRDDVSTETKDTVYLFAKNEMDTEIASRPLNARPYYVASVLAASAGMFDDALGYIDEAIAHSRDKVQFVLYKTLLLIYKGSYDEAISSGRIGYDLAPESPIAVVLLSKAYVLAGEIEHAHTLVFSVPDDMRIGDKSLAQMFVDEGDYAAAVRVWRDVVDEESRKETIESSTLISYASLLANDGRIDEARDILQRAIEQFPDDAERLETLMGQL